MSDGTTDASSERTTLEHYSAQLGTDPLQIQAAGGNTSVKQGNVLWIKASGKWLMHAENEPLFVPVDREALLLAVQQSDPRAEKSVDFVLDELNPYALRPSIETTLHAIMPQRVVIHIHCVDTIALAVREDAKERLASVLGHFRWVFVPYVRPGLPLSTLTAQHLQPDTDVVVLGNHGLVVAADDVPACLQLLQRVRRAVKTLPQESEEAGIPSASTGNEEALASLANRLEGSVYQSAQIPQAHAIAFNESATRIASGGSLYPDHVIFLGEGTVVAAEHESAEEVVDRYRKQQLPPPVSIVFPGAGVAMLDTATPGQQAMARCLSDVCVRVCPDASIRYLDDKENFELLNWEAEQYRQTLNK